MKNSVLRALGWGAAMCMLALVILCARSIAAIPTGAWGLHFSGDGAAPAGSAPKQALAKYDAVYLGLTHALPRDREDERVRLLRRAVRGVNPLSGSPGSRTGPPAPRAWTGER